MSFHDLPAINATLNAISTILLVAGYLCIRRDKWRAHAVLMLSALATSAAFLACYVTYHSYRMRHGIGVSRFPASPWRPVYLSILIPHTILAVAILPLIGTTVIMAALRKWPAHRRVAIITFPLWLYVSITGVVVYWMLYHLAPTLAQ